MHQQCQHTEQDRFASAQDALGCTLQTQLAQRHAVNPPEVDQLTTGRLAPKHLVCAGGVLDIAH
ncbi:hypothetical protein D3C78_1967980 [compost metagenome]